MTEGSSTNAGRWPLVATIGLALLGGGSVLAWGLVGVFTGESPVGDGRDPSTYGVDLTELGLPSDAVAATGNPRDFLAPYVAPETLPGLEVAAWNADHARKWQKEVVSGDRVVGVSVGGVHRAYPLFIVDAHEIVIDELGGVPIVLTRSPLVDETMAYDRRGADGGVAARFGVSGLLGDLALLVHDAEEGTPEEAVTLHSARTGRAVAGPGLREDHRWTPLPGVSIARWRDWLAAHPETSVVVRDPGSMRRYRRISYDRYLDGDAWLVPPRAVPEGGGDASLDPRARVLSLVEAASGRVRAVLPIAELRDRAIRDRVRIEVDDRTVELQPDVRGDAVLVVESGGFVTRQGMWIGAWLDAPEDAIEALARGRSAMEP